MKKKLKLYVWEDVFSDYTSGIAFALATSPDQARELIIKKYVGTGKPTDFMGRFAAQELRGEPQVFSRAVGFQQSGGG